MKAGNHHGEGVINFNNGSRYEGTLVNGKAQNGKGRFYEKE